MFPTGRAEANRLFLIVCPHINNNPINFNDPSGHRPCVFCGEQGGGAIKGTPGGQAEEAGEAVEASMGATGSESGLVEPNPIPSETQPDLNSFLENENVGTSEEQTTMEDFGEEKPNYRPYRNYDSESTGDTIPRNSTEVSAMQHA